MSDLLAARQAHAQLEGQLMAAKVAALKQKQKHQHEVSVQAADMDRAGSTPQPAKAANPRRWGLHSICRFTCLIAL